MRLLDNEFFDVLLLDIQVLQMAALQTTAAIRQLQRNATTYLPIVGITAYKVEGEQCVASGMDAYLTKPIRANALIDLLERLAAPKEDNSQESPLPEEQGLSTSPLPPDPIKIPPSKSQVKIRLKGSLKPNPINKGGNGL